MAISLFRALLWAALALASLSLCALLVFGGPGGPLAGRSPLNIEGIAAVSFLLLSLCRPAHAGAADAGARLQAWSRRDFLLMGSIGGCALLFFARNLDAPLVFDDYRHIYDVSNESWRGVLRWFTSPSHAAFFRPIGFVSYFVDCLWAGRDPLRWHVTGFVVHAVNCMLAYLFGRQLRVSRGAAAVAGLMFAIHASRPEAVGWTDARFDVLATCFVLISLTLLNRFFDTGRQWPFGLAMLAAVLAILTKEAAYCLPLLVVCLIPLRERQDRRSVVKAAIALSTVCAVGFVYRWWSLGGVGGYYTVDGRQLNTDFNLLRAGKALIFRLWTQLVFPINWSVDLGISLKIALFALLVAMVAASWFAWPSGRRLVAALGMVLASALPVQQLLLIGSDLNGARLLYLPVLGIALWWGLLMEGLGDRRLRFSIALGVLFFHAIALQHNQRMWREVPALARNACVQVGQELARDPRPIRVRGLPPSLHGVYFIANGFPECVLFNSGQDPRRVRTGDAVRASADDTARILTWNREKLRFDEVGK